MVVITINKQVIFLKFYFSNTKTSDKYLLLRVTNTTARIRNCVSVNYTNFLEQIGLRTLYWHKLFVYADCFRQQSYVMWRKIHYKKQILYHIYNKLFMAFDKEIVENLYLSCMASIPLHLLYVYSFNNWYPFLCQSATAV